MMTENTLRFMYYEDTSMGILFPPRCTHRFIVSSPVPNCEGPVAPSSGLGKIAEIGPGMDLCSPTHPQKAADGWGTAPLWSDTDEWEML